MKEKLWTQDKNMPKKSIQFSNEKQCIEKKAESVTQKSYRKKPLFIIDLYIYNSFI